jgi:hypothetical protein
MEADMDDSGDLLRGAAAIAEHLLGDSRRRREIYNLRNELPIFKLNGMLAATRSGLRAALSEQERAARERAAAAGRAPPEGATAAA